MSEESAFLKEELLLEPTNEKKNAERSSPSERTTYDKEAQRKYRDKNREKYNISQRELYYKLHQDEEWRAMFNERSKRNNLLSRQKKREEFLRSNPTAIIRGRGRPRKIISLENPTEGVIPTDGLDLS
jgi:hypothetical protein